MPLRIAVWHNLPSGGAKRALHCQVRGLVERGHHVEAWCPSTADDEYLPLSGIIEEHRLLLDWPPTIGRIKDAVRPYFRIASRLRAMEEHAISCAREIEAGGFDVLFANSCRFFRVPALGRLVRLPTVLYLQEPYRWLYEALPRLPWIGEERRGTWYRPTAVIRRLREQIELAGLRVQARTEVANAIAYDRVLCNSRFSRESLLRAYGLSATVCPLGVDGNQFVPHSGIEKADQVIGVGTICPEKNVDLIVRAVATMPRPPPALAWVGNAVNSAYLEKTCALARQLDVDFNVHVSVSDEQLVTELNRSFAFVYAPRLEPLGLAPLEANACEVPVVAAAEGGVRETIVNGVNGVLVDGDEASIGRALHALRSDRGSAERLGKDGRHLVLTRWRWEDAISSLERSLLEVSGRSQTDDAAPSRDVAG